MRLSLRKKSDFSDVANSGRRSAQSMIDQIAQALSPAVDRAASTAHDAVGTARSAADAAAGWIGERSETVQAAQRRLVAQTGKYVAAHPFKSLGFVFVAGVIFARIMR